MPACERCGRNVDEIEDAGPLLYQLYWAIEDLERSKGGEG